MVDQSGLLFQAGGPPVPSLPASAPAPPHWPLPPNRSRISCQSNWMLQQPPSKVRLTVCRGLVVASSSTHCPSPSVQRVVDIGARLWPSCLVAISIVISTAVSCCTLCVSLLFTEENWVLASDIPDSPLLTSCWTAARAAVCPRPESALARNATIERCNYQHHRQTAHPSNRRPTSRYSQLQCCTSAVAPLTWWPGHISLLHCI